MVQTQRTLHNSGRGGTELINPLELDRCAYAENERAIGQVESSYFKWTKDKLHLPNECCLPPALLQLTDCI